MEKNNIVWFTQNLRIRNNAPLNEALASNKPTFGVYFFNPVHYKEGRFGFKKTEKFRAKFIIESVKNLQENLKKLNIPLLIINGKPQDHFLTITKKYNVGTIYYQEEWTSEEVMVIQASIKSCAEVKWLSFYDQFLYHPKNLPFLPKDTPKVFTAFRNKVEKYSTIEKENTPIPSSLPIIEIENSNITTLTQLGFKDFDVDNRTAFPFSGGEDAALKRLEDYFWETKNLSIYKETRNGLIGINYSSKFSPWLALGCISPKTIYYFVKEYEKKVEANDSTYWLIFELIWRDFFKYISLKHGNNIFKLSGILEKNYPWNTQKKLINDWIGGNTHEPFVNANMLELKHTGWMSNRGRQNVSSYFAKNLKLDWRIGAAYFEAMLLDYDVHSNYGNWLYVSGVGNDPRDRVFNVALQAERYDPQNEFQKLWLN